MSEVGHDLHTLFPAEEDILHALKLEDEHYRQLAERHHNLLREIDRIESGIEAASDERLEELKKLRLELLDQVADMIAKRKAK